LFPKQRSLKEKKPELSSISVWGNILPRIWPSFGKCALYFGRPLYNAHMLQRHGPLPERGKPSRYTKRAPGHSGILRLQSSLSLSKLERFRATRSAWASHIGKTVLKQLFCPFYKRTFGFIFRKLLKYASKSHFFTVFRKYKKDSQTIVRVKVFKILLYRRFRFFSSNSAPQTARSALTLAIPIRVNSVCEWRPWKEPLETKRLDFVNEYSQRIVSV
jgi:hypothetical protein